ncbi:5-formyltetrahydrofolate cyclo-ligase [Niveibacterium sp. 24ML]|nr:5-formyltetrahydrofolate cyclo-ligase [Niveibacterium sp. 24ML]
MRRRAIAAREALDAQVRHSSTQALCRALDALLARLHPQVLAFCWPYRGEADLTDWIAGWLAAAPDRVAALPVVQASQAPLAFSRWVPGDPMRPDAFGIPVPAKFQPLDPDLLLVPLNAFDDKGFRLGYGGGFFDRTLAARAGLVRTVGVGFELGRVESILPEAHDRPLDWIVTERGTFGPFSGG